MQIRPLAPDDIPAAAALLRCAAEEFILHESTPADGAVFLAEQGEQGMRGFLAKGYVYHVAEVDESPSMPRSASCRPRPPRPASCATTRCV